MTTAELLVLWRRREDHYGPRRRLTPEELAIVANWRQREMADAIGDPVRLRRYLALWLLEVAA